VNWTLNDLPDLSGKVIVITGANSGIGYESARAFARNGAQIILACRDNGKANQALLKIQAEVPGTRGVILQLDLTSLQSVHDFTERFKTSYNRLDILLNNAGIMMVPYGVTADGFEKQLGTNHLGPFALTGLLIDRLLETPGFRIVTVSSNAHYSGELDFKDLMFADGRGYSPMKAYNRSKLANLLFTYELQRRLDAHEADTIAVAAHPGISDTGLAGHFFDHWYSKVFRPLMGALFQSAAMGALPSIRAAVDPLVVGGQYYGPDGKGERSGFPVVVQSNQTSHSLEDALQLWEISEKLTGIRYLD